MQQYDLANTAPPLEAKSETPRIQEKHHAS